MNDARPQTSQCLYERNKSVRLGQHSRGFTTYALEPGLHVVLMLNVDVRVPDSSVRLARELVIELKGEPPLHQPLDISEWARTVLYKFGGPQIQFESQAASGALELTGLTGQGTCHGRVHLTFSKPSIDRVGEGQAALDLTF